MPPMNSAPEMILSNTVWLPFSRTVDLRSYTMKTGSHQLWPAWDVESAPLLRSKQIHRI